MANIYEFNYPPVKGSAWTFYIALVSQADTDVFKTSPTLASGDVKVSKDGGSFSNIASLPSEIGTSGVLKVDLSSGEMNADVVVVKFSDVSGAEWQDALAVIYTTASVTPDVAVASIAANTVNASALASDAATEIANQVDATLSSSHGSGLWGGASGSGATETTITITDGSSPLDGVEVWVTTDAAGSNIVASGVTDALGKVVFMLDPGTYYVWKQLSGYNFTNPEQMTVT